MEVEIGVAVSPSAGAAGNVQKSAPLSRHQMIDKVGQLFGHSLVSKDNRLIKSLNHDTCHLSRHDCDVKTWQTITTPTLLCCFIF